MKLNEGVLLSTISYGSKKFRIGKKLKIVGISIEPLVLGNLIVDFGDGVLRRIRPEKVQRRVL